MAKLLLRSIGIAGWNILHPSVLYIRNLPMNVCDSSFHNTDLDYQLKQRGITHVVIAGLLQTPVEATARYAYEL
jgi:nicotinamidase-related amidase